MLFLSFRTHSLKLFKLEAPRFVEVKHLSIKHRNLIVQLIQLLQQCELLCLNVHDFIGLLFLDPRSSRSG